MSRGSYSPFSGAKAAATFTGGKILNKEFHRNPTIWYSCNLQLPFYKFVSWPSHLTFGMSIRIFEPRYTKGVVAKVAWSWLRDDAFKIYHPNCAHGIFGYDYLICLSARILMPSLIRLWAGITHLETECQGSSLERISILNVRFSKYLQCLAD